MPDENLRNALSALFPDIFKGEKISSSAKYVTFTDGTLNISDKNITSLEGLEYFSNISETDLQTIMISVKFLQKYYPDCLN